MSILYICEKPSQGHLSLDNFLAQQIKVLKAMLIAIAAKKQTHQKYT